jgi:hypothetical protein
MNEADSAGGGRNLALPAGLFDRRSVSSNTAQVVWFTSNIIVLALAEN